MMHTAPARARTGVLAAATAAVLLLSACGAPDGSDSSSEGSGGTPGPTASQGTDAATAPALDFTATTVEGEEFSGASLQGEPAVLWFWAPWCTVCRGEAASVAKAAERYAGEIEFYGVPGRGEVPEMKEFIADTGITNMRHIVDEDGSIWSGFEVTGQPSISLLRPDGSFLTVSGTVTDERLDAYIVDELTG